MANIRKIEGKTGSSYKVTVFAGRDANGVQIRHYKTWVPEPGMTERKAENEAKRVAFEFEKAIRDGYAADDRQTFDAFAEYVLDLKERSGMKHKTLTSYRYLLVRINPELGHIKLADIRPAHLNALYKKLAAPGARGGLTKAKPKLDITAVLKDLKFTRDAIAEKADLSPTTITAICRGGTVSKETADKLAAALGQASGKLFTFEKDTRTLSSKTILEYHRCIHSILSQAEKEMLIPYNAAAKATPPKAARKEVNYLQPETLMNILDALDAEPIKWRVITHLLIVTGCRRGEIAALKWSKVDFNNSQVRIDASLLYDPDKGIYENSTKTGDTRFLKLPAETIGLLRDYRQWYIELRFKRGDLWSDTGYMFVKDDGTPMNPNSITAWMREFSERHGLQHINPHAFRHSVASVLINSGHDIVTVSKRLGHSRSSTTLDIYAHLVQEADATASECIADTLLRRHG